MVNSRIKSKIFYETVGKFIVECVHHMRFQRQRAWTESHRADDVLDWTPFRRMNEEVWRPLLDRIDEEHRNDGFAKTFFLRLFGEESIQANHNGEIHDGDTDRLHSSIGASKAENWERLVRDWKACIEQQVISKLEGLHSAQTDSFRDRIGPYDGSDNPQYEVEEVFLNSGRFRHGK